VNKTHTQRADSLAWNDENLSSPHDDTAKADRVNAMFDAIADSYDLNNRLHSLWRDQAWRRKAVRVAEVRAGLDHVVDVACGTGDLSFAFADASPASIIGIDFVPKMIEIAQKKASVRFGDRSHSGENAACPDFRVGDAMALDLDDACADVVSIAFGIRNVTDPQTAINEFSRVLRPGGRLLVLEFSEPRNPLFRFAYNVYFHRIMPMTATLISRDRSGAYRYLPRSVSTFCTPDVLTGMMGNAGFNRTRVVPLTFGICSISVGWKEGEVC